MVYGAPERLDLTLYRGSSEPILAFSLHDPDGSPQNLTSHDVILTARLSITPIIASIANGGLSVDSHGLISWSLSAADRRRFRGATPYTIERRHPDGEQYPMMIGVITALEYPNV